MSDRVVNGAFTKSESNFCLLLLVSLLVGSLVLLVRVAPVGVSVLEVSSATVSCSSFLFMKKD